MGYWAIQGVYIPSNILPIKIILLLQFPSIFIGPMLLPLGIPGDGLRRCL